MNDHNPQVGVVADNALQRHIVCQAVKAVGYDIGVNLPPERVDDELIKGDQMDVWLVEIEDEEQWSDFIDAMFQEAHAPILFGDGQAPALNSRQYPRWQRRIYAKIKDIVGQPLSAKATKDVVSLDAETESAPEPATPLLLPVELQGKKVTGIPAEYIWVLGASLGGPKAVKAFLDALPDGFPMAFVIAQHIDAGFQKTLEKVWQRNNNLEFVDPMMGNVLSHGQVVIAPVEQVMTMDKDARVVLKGEEWEGPYSPSIDQVMNLMVDNLKGRTGAILFSGMGNDGAIAGPRMHTMGLQVWAQSAETCACSSQPDSARATGCVQFSGSPRELAEHLVEYAKNNLDYLGDQYQVGG